MLKVLVSVAFIWLSLGAAGAVMIDLRHPARLADVALGPSLWARNCSAQRAISATSSVKPGPNIATSAMSFSLS